MELSYNKGDTVVLCDDARIRHQGIEWLTVTDQNNNRVEVPTKKYQSVLGDVLSRDEFIIKETRFQMCDDFRQDSLTIDGATLATSSRRIVSIQSRYSHKKHGIISMVIDDQMLRPTTETFNQMMLKINRDWIVNWPLIDDGMDD